MERVGSGVGEWWWVVVGGVVGGSVWCRGVGVWRRLVVVDGEWSRDGEEGEELQRGFEPLMQLEEGGVGGLASGVGGGVGGSVGAAAVGWSVVVVDGVVEGWREREELQRGFEPLMQLEEVGIGGW
ncbi:hypothetical protein BC829DRAFT_418388 [Chytridium lagenaria]|nr:hypothetical protein BC829DRAFT_418388 [Chytridium lagenaria]